MLKKCTRWMAVFMTAVMVLGATGLLAGCGGGSGSEPQIKDAASLVKANQAVQADVENYHMDLSMNMEVTLQMDELKEMLGTSTMSMPMDMTMSMDAGKTTAHATSNSKMNLMGQSVDQDAEMYIDIAGGATYTKAAGSDQWIRTETDSSMSDMMNSMSEMSTELLEKAAFAETEEGYTMTLDASQMGDAIKELNLFSSYSASGMEMESFNINSGELVYTFDKESVLLTKIEMKAVDVTAKGSMSGTTVNMHVPITAAMDYSQYGEIDPKTYEIPADVTGEK